MLITICYLTELWKYWPQRWRFATLQWCVCPIQLNPTPRNRKRRTEESLRGKSHHSAGCLQIRQSLCSQPQT